MSALTAEPESSTAAADAPEEDVFIFPATLAQRRFWLLDQMAPGGNPALNMPEAARLTGQLNRAALERALQAVVERHEALRTTFHDAQGRLQQVIAPALRVDLPLVDVQSFPEAERARVPEHLVNEEAQMPFDLARGPLLRVRLVRLAPTDHLLLFTVHHIVSDGWSNGILLRELGELYTAFVRGQTDSPLPELSLQFADFADWQAKALADGSLGGQIDYWRERLAGDLPALELPADHRRPRRAGGIGAPGAFCWRALSPELTRDLKALAVRESASAYMVFLAGFAALLHRLTGGTEDLIISTPSANRPRQELESVVGLFVNPLLLRIDAGGGPTFVQLLGRVRETALEAFAHADAPFERIIEEVRPRQLQVNFLYQPDFLRPARLPDLTLAPQLGASGGAVFEWTGGAIENDEGVRLLLEYNTLRFDRPTAERTLAQFECLLAAAAADPRTPVGALPLLKDEESARLLEGARTLYADRARLPEASRHWMERCCEFTAETQEDQAEEDGADAGAGGPDAAPLFGRTRGDGRFIVLDARLQPAPPGVTGEIFAAGAPEGAAGFPREAFADDPGQPGGRLFRTGDLGIRRPDERGGGIEWLRRRDQPGAAAVLPAGKQTRAGKSREPRRDTPYLTVHYQLLEIWQDVLGTRDIGIKDDFFALGGNSLLALRMLDRVEQVCGQSLLPAALFKQATIEYLANELLTRESKQAPMVLKIEEGGTRAPLFYLHGDLTGGGYYTMKLSRRLGRDQPFYALPPTDVNALTGELPTIETMAALHVEAIRAVRPHGPYVIGGFCLGGLVAYEVARQLAAAGERVERLAIIDATAHSPRENRLRRFAQAIGRRRGLDEDRQLYLFCKWHYLLARLERWAGLDAQEQSRIVLRHLRRVWRRLTGKAETGPREGMLDAAVTPGVGRAAVGRAAASTWYDPRWDAPMIFLWAAGGYQPGPYAGPMTLLLSRDLLPGGDTRDPTEDWKKLAPRTEARELPGSHLGCITEHVDELAEAFRRALQEPAALPRI